MVTGTKSCFILRNVIYSETEDLIFPASVITILQMTPTRATHCGGVPHHNFLSGGLLAYMGILVEVRFNESSILFSYLSGLTLFLLITGSQYFGGHLVSLKAVSRIGLCKGILVST